MMISRIDWRTFLDRDPSALILRLDAAPLRRLRDRLFLKELARVGRWEHPETGEVVEFSQPDLAEIETSTTAWIASQGGKIPIPDGHSFDARRTIGYCLSCFVDGDRLMGLCEAGDDEIAGKFGTTIRDVSIYLEGRIRDSQGRVYKNAITHVAATPYPVLTELENFVKLARGGEGARRVPVLRLAAEPGKESNMSTALKNIAEALGLTATDDTDDEKLEDAIKAKAKLMADEASACATKSKTALAAKDGEVIALASRIASLEGEKKARDEADMNGAIAEVKALAAKAGNPAAFAPEDEAAVKDLWPTNRAHAQRMLALARAPLAGSASSGTVVMAGPAPNEAAQKARDRFDTKIALARHAGNRVEIVTEGKHAIVHPTSAQAHGGAKAVDVKLS